MPQFEPTGVRLVAENADQYIATLQRARQATLEFGTASGGPAAQGVQQLSVGTIALGGTLANLAAQGLTQAWQALERFGQEAINNVAYLEDVRINIESMTAAEILGAGGTEDMSTALDQAAPIAENVMKKLQDLSLASPFQYRQILDVYSMNKAFGQSSEMSLELTRAITNLSSVAKNIPGITQRLSYNFSQMAMVGKITGRDMRDLAMVGLDLKKVLKKELGMTVEEVNEKMESGAMTFEEVSKALITYTDKYFGEAAERAARTWNGVKSSFADLAFFASVDIFGGAMAKATDKLVGFFDVAMKFVQGGGLKPIGAALELVTDGLFAMTEQAGAAGQSFINEWGDKIGQAVSDAFNWGSNLIIEFAAGIAEGASIALSQAMDAVSSLLGFFLAPGSPPRVASDIDAWGAGAMNAYLQGFTEADFGLLSSVGGSIQKVLGAVAGAGLIDKKDQEGLYQAYMQQFTAIMAEGKSITPFLDDLKSSYGTYGAQVADLISKQYQLSQATNQVAKAEAALLKAREDEEKANQALVAAMDDYNAAAKAGASPEVLAQKRAAFELAKKQRAEASKAGDLAEKDLIKASKEQQTLKEKASLQDQLLSQLVDITKQTKEAEKTAKGGKGAGAEKGAGAPAAGAGGFGALAEEASGAMEEAMGKMKEGIKGKLGEAFAPLTEAWEKAKKKLEPSWNRLMEVLGQFYDQVLKPVGTFLAEHIFTPEVLNMLGKYVGYLLGMGAAFLVVKGIVIVIGAIIAAIMSPLGILIALLVGVAVAIEKWPEALNSLKMLGAIIGAFGKKIGGFFVKMVKEGLTAGKQLLIVWGKNWKKLWNDAKGAWETLRKTVKLAIVVLIKQNIEFAARLVKSVADWWERVVKGAKDAWENLTKTVKLSILLLIKQNIEFAARLVKSVADWWEKIKAGVSSAWNGITEAVSSAVKSLATTIGGWWSSITTAVQSWWDKVKESISTAWNGIATALYDAIVGPGGLITKIKSWVGDVVFGFNSWWEQVKTGIVNAWTGTKGIIDALWEAVVGTQSNSLVSRIKGWASDIVTAVGEWWSKIITSLPGAWKAIIDKMVQAVKDALGWHSPPKVFVDLGKGIAAGLALGITSGSALVSAAMQSILPDTQALLDQTGRRRAYGADAASAKMSLASGGAQPVVVKENGYNLTLNTKMEAETVQMGFDVLKMLGG